ncbi:hypothetical protein TNCV_3909391 [Trichonephila clavipes]|nr:hypothetical protein TNCV_3909391 [Trichonephila clavipes]
MASEPGVRSRVPLKTHRVEKPMHFKSVEVLPLAWSGSLEKTVSVQVSSLPLGRGQNYEVERLGTVGVEVFEKGTNGIGSP